jgi:aspartyl-tRNA(Asn)/glutamyl-tRNA(Gln) amidotransferase subunit A
MSLSELAEQLGRREISPREAVQHYLKRIEKYDGEINSYISVREEQALSDATALEEIEAADRGPLWGVPVAIKDVIDVEGSVTTCGSYVTEGANPAEQDAGVVENLRAAGAIVLGKLNTHEFAYGAMTTSPRFGPGRNPWSTDRIVGGSSGGSGACSAARLAAGSLGTDTAGSVRIPASFNGVTGLRPTTGRVSNRGVFPVSYTYDTVGPLAPSAQDCALMLGGMAGVDPADPSTADVPVPDYAQDIGAGVKGLRVGVVRSLLDGDIDSGIAGAVEAGIEELRGLGAQVSDVAIPTLEHFGTIQQATQFADATQIHGPTLRTNLDAYGPDVRARLLTGLFIPSAVYAAGQRARRAAYGTMRDAFRDIDILCAPTMPVLPPRIGEDTVELNGRTTLYRLTIIPYNSPWSLVGLPVLSVPCGFVDGMPVGMALIGWRFAESTVFQAGHAYQQATNWHSREPALTSTTN